MGFNLDGIIDGNAQVSNLNGNPSILANLGIDDFKLDGNRFGDLRISSYWDYLNNSIFLETSLVDFGKPTFSLIGFYNTEKEDNSLDFKLKLDSLQLNSLSKFTQGIMSRMQGTGNGDFTIGGSLKKPVIEGELSIENGGGQIDYLKTFYTFSPTIRLTENEKTITRSSPNNNDNPIIEKKCPIHPAVIPNITATKFSFNTLNLLYNGNA